MVQVYHLVAHLSRFSVKVFLRRSSGLWFWVVALTVPVSLRWCWVLVWSFPVGGGVWGPWGHLDRHEALIPGRYWTQLVSGDLAWLVSFRAIVEHVRYVVKEIRRVLVENVLAPRIRPSLRSWRVRIRGVFGCTGLLRNSQTVCGSYSSSFWRNSRLLVENVSRGRIRPPPRPHRGKAPAGGWAGQVAPPRSLDQPTTRGLAPSPATRPLEDSRRAVTHWPCCAAFLRPLATQGESTPRGRLTIEFSRPPGCDISGELILAASRTPEARTLSGPASPKEGEDAGDDAAEALESDSPWDSRFEKLVSVTMTRWWRFWMISCVGTTLSRIGSCARSLRAGITRRGSPSRTPSCSGSQL